MLSSFLYIRLNTISELGNAFTCQYRLKNKYIQIKLDKHSIGFSRLEFFPLMFELIRSIFREILSHSKIKNILRKCAKVTVEHVLLPKNAMSRLGFDCCISRIVSNVLPTVLKEFSTNAASRSGFEPTIVPITLGMGAFPLHT